MPAVQPRQKRESKAPMRFINEQEGLDQRKSATAVRSCVLMTPLQSSTSMRSPASCSARKPWSSGVS